MLQYFSPVQSHQEKFDNQQKQLSDLEPQVLEAREAQQSGVILLYITGIIVTVGIVSIHSLVLRCLTIL